MSSTTANTDGIIATLGCFDCGSVLKGQYLDKVTWEQFLAGEIGLVCPTCGYLLHNVTSPVRPEPAPEPELLPCWDEALADVDIAGLLDGQVPA